MSTNDKKVNIFLKKFLPRDQFADNFLEYLLTQSRDILATLYPDEGVFYGGGLGGSGADEFTVGTPMKATDGVGHMMDLDPLYAAVKFENSLGIPYHVGLRYQDMPRDTEINVRTGAIEYTFFEEAIGEKADPTAVVDNGTTITFNVDSITEVGVSNAGRTVRAWMKNALGQADAFFEGVVYFSGGSNKVDTTHLFGQTAGLVSTNPADYEVMLMGPTVKRNTNLSADPNYVYLGTVEGAGAGNTPTVFDDSNVNILFGAGSVTPVMDQLFSILTGGGNVTWDLTTQTLSWTAQFVIVMPNRPYTFQISGGSQAAIADGDTLYIVTDLVGGVKPIIKVGAGLMPDSEFSYPIAIRKGNEIYFRDGVLELKGDSTPTTGRIDGITEDILSYIGAANESDADPDYTNATGSAKPNIHLTDAESLTRSIKKLELRPDVVTKVRAVAFLETVLPELGNPTAPVVDGQTLINGDDVLFMDPVLNGVYRVSGIGTAVVWTKLPVFSGGLVPIALSLVGVKDSADEFMRTVFQYTPTRGWRPLNTDEIESEPTGFVKRTDSEFSFDDGTRTFTIQPKSPATYFFYVQKGKLYKVAAAKTVVIPDAEGLHFIYFDGNTLTSTQVFDLDIIVAKTFVATVHWNATANVAIMLSDERHLVTMDGATHAYLHNTNGTQYASGLGLSGSVVGDGSTDAHAQVSLDGGRIYDEDIIIDIVDDPTPANIFEQILSPIAQIPVFYREGATGDWKKVAANNFPLKAGAARPQWNELQAGPTWAAVDATADGKFIAMYLLATNDINNPIIAIMGQREDNSLTDAQNNNNIESLDLTGLPTLEFKALYRIIYEADATYANSINARQREFTDLRFAEQLGTAGISPTDHNALSGRTAAGSHPSQAISTTPSDFGGAGSALDINAKLILKTIDDHFKALRIHEHPSNKQRVVVTGASTPLNTGTVLEQQIRNLIVKFDGIQINFQTGEIFEADGVTPFNGGLNDFTPVIPPVGEDRWAGLTLLPNTVNADNTINLQPLVLISASDNFRAVFASGIKVGQIKLQEDSGGIADILQDAITQQGVGGGGGGDGSGNANTYLTQLDRRLQSDQFLLKWLTPNIFALHEDDRLDNSSTGAFDIANGEFDFDVAAEFLLSSNHYGSSFLGNEKENYHLELDVLWNTEDTAAVYQAAKDGVTFETVTMEKVENSPRYRGVHVFAEPPATTQYEYDNVNADTNTELNATTRQAFAIKLPVLAAGVKKKIMAANIYVNKTGLPTGDLYVRLVKNNAGVPTGDLVTENLETINIENLSAGLNTIAVDLSGILVAGTYWLVLETSAAYKAGFSAGITSIQARTDTSAPSYSEGNSFGFDGTTWAAIAGTHGVFELLGFTFDLRVKVTASMQSSMQGYGIYYGEQQPFVYENHMAIERFEIDGDDDVTELTLTKMIPDAMTCKVYVVNSGQVLRYPAFAIDGRKLVFASGQFLSPGNLITVLVDQSEAQVFDNSDANANLMASNHLGSTDPGIDRSMAGRGVVLRRPDGTLREVTLDNSDNIVILSVP